MKVQIRPRGPSSVKLKFQLGIPGREGDKGWGPVLATVADGQRRVYQLVDWVGGEGAKPTYANPTYLTPTGWSADISQATDVRGPQGPQGLKGDKGDKGDKGAPGNLGFFVVTDAPFNAPADGVTDAQPAIQAAIAAAAAAGGGVVFFPAGTYLVKSGIDLTGRSNIALVGAAGWSSVIKCSADLNGSNNSTKNDLIYALNFSGQTTASGYPHKNLMVEGLVLDCTLMNGNGIDNDADDDGIPDWQDGMTNYGRSLAAVEFLNVDDAVIRRNKIIRAFGNGAVIGTEDPRLFNDAGQPNGLRNPIIEENLFHECVRGLLPQYGSPNAPNGITGTVVQIGSCHGGRIAKNYCIRPGAPFSDTFNCDSLEIVDNYIEGYSGTPIGSSDKAASTFHQTVGTIHSDFGLSNCVISRNVFMRTGGIYLEGAMHNGGFFNGYTRTPGPVGCTITDNKIINPQAMVQIAAPTLPASGAAVSNNRTQPVVVFITGGAGVSVSVRRGTDGTWAGRTLGPQGVVALYAGDGIAVTYTTAPTWVWYLAPNLDAPGIALFGGSVSGFPGQASGNVIQGNRIINPGGAGFLLYDASSNVIEDNYVENAYLLGGGAAFDLYTQIVQAGGGSSDNRIKNNTVVESRNPGALLHAYRDDNGTYCLRNEFTGNNIPPTTGEAVNMKSATGVVSVPRTYTPTVTANTGSLTTVSNVSGAYYDVPDAKERHFSAKATITNNGTGAGGIRISLPSTPVGDFLVVRGSEDGLTGKALNAIISGSTIYVRYYDGTYPGANGAVLNVSGIYRTA